jgi:hypothetical protein
MNNQRFGEMTGPAIAGQRLRPLACIADSTRHMQIFLGRALQDLGFMSYECSHVANLRATVDSLRPDLILIGVSGGGIEACEMIELLAAKQFRGKILVLGPRLSPMVMAVRGLGQKLGLRVLPLLSTPFAAGDVRDYVIDRLPE